MEVDSVKAMSVFAAQAAAQAVGVKQAAKSSNGGPAQGGSAPGGSALGGSALGGSAPVTSAASPSPVEVEGRVVQAAPEVHSEAGGGNALRQVFVKDDKAKLEMPGGADADTLKRAIDDVNKAIEGVNRRVDVSVHQRTGHIMVKIVDDETGEVVREIPSEKTLDYLAKVLEKAGVLVDAEG